MKPAIVGSLNPEVEEFTVRTIGSSGGAVSHTAIIIGTDLDVRN